MNAVVKEIYDSGMVVDARGQLHALHSHVGCDEGEFLCDLIASDQSIRRSFEIGCAYGLSSLHITAALHGRENISHTIIDPFQASHWGNIGVENLRRTGVDFFELIEEPSEFALPQLVKAQPEAFDFGFIDGWHTFDHTLLDMFYANRLIRVGGYIVVDDCGMASVAKAISYVANYPCYQVHSQSKDIDVSAKRKVMKRVFGVMSNGVLNVTVPKRVYDTMHRVRYSRMVALKKIASDRREWTWFRDF